MEEWFAQIPPVTRVFFVGSFATTLAANFGLISPSLLVLDFGLIWHKFQIWRLVTPFFFMGGLGFPFLIQMMYLYTHSTKLEEGSFAGRRADYVWMFLTCGALLLGLAPLLNLRVLGQAMIMVVLYVWSQRHPDGIVSFYFGIKFPAVYMPWALVGLTIVMGGVPYVQLLGIFVGHVYFWLEDIAPERLGARYLETPSFMYRLFPKFEGGGRGGATDFRAPGRVPPPAGGYNWGGGAPLGTR